MDVSGETQDKATYDYSSDAPDPNEIAIDSDDAKDGLLTLGFGFKAKGEDEKIAVEDIMGKLEPGWQASANDLLGNNNSMWVVFYGGKGTYSANFANGGGSGRSGVWSSNGDENIELTKPGFDVFQFSFDEEGKNESLTVANYTATVSNESDEKEVSTETLPLSRVEYSLGCNDASCGVLPKETFYQPNEKVTITSEKPVRDGYTFAGSWHANGETYRSGAELTTTSEPKDYSLEADWTEVPAELSLGVSDDLGSVDAGSDQTLNATVKNTLENSRTGKLTVSVDLPDQVSLKDGASSVKTGSNPSAKVTLKEGKKGFTVEADNLGHNQSLSIDYEVVVSEDASTGPCEISVAVKPTSGNEASGKTTLNVVAKPSLQLTVEPSDVPSIDAGSTKEIKAMLSNNVEASDAGSTTVTFTLGSHLTLEGGIQSVKTNQEGAIPSVAESGNNFTVTTDQLKDKKPLTVTFTVAVAKDAPTGDSSVSVVAKPTKGNQPTGQALFHIVALPVLEIATSDVSVVQGYNVKLTTTVNNTALGSSAGETNITFTLPSDVTLTEGETSVTVEGGKEPAVSVADNTFTVTTKDITTESPLTVTYDVTVGHDVSAGAKTINIKAEYAETASVEETASITVALASKLSVASKETTVQQGLSQELSYSVKNDVEGSHTGSTTITFTLPDGLELEEGSATASCGEQKPSVSAEGKTIQATVADIVPGTPLMVSFTVHAADDAPAGETTIAMRGTSNKGEPLETTAPLTIIAKPVLALSFEAAQSLEVTQGSSIDLTATVQNTVPQSITGQTLTTLILPEGVGLSAEAQVTSGTGEVSISNNVVSVTADNIDANEPLVVTLTLTAAKSATPGEQTITASTEPTQGAGAQTTATVKVNELLGLAVEVDPAKMALQQGSTATLSAKVKNTVSESDPGAVTASFVLPDGVSLNSEDTSSVTVTPEAKVTKTENGFSVLATTVSSEDPLVVSYTILAARDATSSENGIDIQVSSEKGAAAFATQRVSVTAMPELKIETTSSSIQQGSTSQLIANVKNNVKESSTGPATITFTLPAGITVNDEIDNPVTVSRGINPHVDYSDSGFSITVDDLTYADSPSITYNLKADAEAIVGEADIEIAITAQKPAKGTTSAKAKLTITQKPELAIRTGEEAGKTTLQQGFEPVKLHAQVNNSVEGSTTGSTTVAFDLPEGIELANPEGTSSVKATYGGAPVPAKTSRDGFDLTLKNGLKNGTPLDVAYEVKATNDAKAGDLPITITATPQQGEGQQITETLSVIGSPKLAIEPSTTDTVYLQQGLTQDLSITVSNTVAQSTTNGTTVTLELPRGVSFEGETNAKDVTVDSVANTLSIKADDIVEGEPLTISCTIRAATDAAAEPTALTVAASPTASGEGARASIPLTIVASPQVQAKTSGATVRQGETTDALVATVSTPTEHSSAGKTTVSLSLPQKVLVAGGIDGVTATQNDAPIPVVPTEGGFSLELDDLTSESPLTVSYAAKAAQDASVGSQVIEMRVKPTYGQEAVSRSTLEISPNSALAIEAPGASLEPGHAAHLVATLTNDTVGSHPGKTTIAFSLPQGVSLDGELANAVKATYEGASVPVAAQDGGFVLTLDEFGYKEPLTISYDIKVAKDQEEAELPITITATPEEGVVSKAKTLIVVSLKETKEPHAADIADSSGTEELLPAIEEATQGLATVEPPKAEVSKDDRSANLAYTVHLAPPDANKADSSESDPDAFEVPDATELGETVIEHILTSAQPTLAKAKSSYAMSMNDPSIELKDIGHASPKDLTAFLTRCVEAVLSDTQEASQMVQGNHTLAELFGKEVTILVITSEGTPDETLITYSFAFESTDSSDTNPGSGEQNPSESEVMVYRLYNRFDGSHLLTTDVHEYESLPIQTQGGWEQEGARYMLPVISPIEIHRLYNPYNGDHLYSTSTDEVDTLTTEAAWQDEGVKLYGAEGENTIPIYRLWNRYQVDNGGLGSHLWTEDENEYHLLPTLDPNGWSQENEVWRALRVLDN